MVGRLAIAACAVIGVVGCGSTSTSSSAGSSGAGSGSSSTLTVQTKSGVQGQVLSTSGGLTLYRYAPDANGGANCTGQCAQTWPLLPASQASALPSGVAGKLGTISGPGGVTQATYDGWPLYTFTTDHSSSDATGQGQEQFTAVLPGVASPNGQPAAAASSQPTATSMAPPTSGSGGGGLYN
jgi:predicted lipoprotein with Yx(FWY)xxD motif